MAARGPQEDGRLVELGWSGRPSGRVGARLRISTVNQPGSLGSITTVIGKQGGNITDVRVGRRAVDVFEMLLDVEVDNLDHLQRLQAALRATPCVTAVERGRA